VAHVVVGDAEVTDLQQVLDRLRAPPVPPRAALDQPGMPGDQDLADRLASGAAARKRAQPRQQLVVGQRLQLSVPSP
jgi:hypothetical protein